MTLTEKAQAVIDMGNARLQQIDHTITALSKERESIVADLAEWQNAIHQTEPSKPRKTKQ